MKSQRTMYFRDLGLGVSSMYLASSVKGEVRQALAGLLALRRARARSTASAGKVGETACSRPGRCPCRGSMLASVLPDDRKCHVGRAASKGRQLAEVGRS